MLLQTEKHLSDMVVGGALYAKIDRPAGTVRFAKHPEPEQLLNSWSNNISKLLAVVNRRCALCYMLLHLCPIHLCLLLSCMHLQAVVNVTQAHSPLCMQLPANTEGVYDS